MSMSETRAASSASDCMRRRIRTGTKLLEPPADDRDLGSHRIARAFLCQFIESSLMGRIVASSIAVGARPRDRVHDGIGDLLGAHHAGQVGIARAPARGPRPSRTRSTTPPGAIVEQRTPRR